MIWKELLHNNYIDNQKLTYLVYMTFVILGNNFTF